MSQGDASKEGKLKIYLSLFYAFHAEREIQVAVFRGGGLSVQGNNLAAVITTYIYKREPEVYIMVVSFQDAYVRGKN